jgi:filamentous hemagglutinin
VRPNGEAVVYDPATNTFGVRAADGTPKTLFKPSPAKHHFPTNMDYFNAQ